MNPELDFVEQVMHQQCLREKTMAVNNKIFTGLRFELGCFSRHIALYEGRVTPISVLQRGRKHILPDSINSLTVLARSMRKSRREELIGSPSQQHPIAR